MNAKIIFNHHQASVVARSQSTSNLLVLSLSNFFPLHIHKYTHIHTRVCAYIFICNYIAAWGPLLLTLACWGILWDQSKIILGTEMVGQNWDSFLLLLPFLSKSDLFFFLLFDKSSKNFTDDRFIWVNKLPLPKMQISGGMWKISHSNLSVNWFNHLLSFIPLSEQLYRKHESFGWR